MTMTSDEQEVNFWSIWSSLVQHVLVQEEIAALPHPVFQSKGCFVERTIKSGFFSPWRLHCTKTRHCKFSSALNLVSRRNIKILDILDNTENGSEKRSAKKSHAHFHWHYLRNRFKDLWIILAIYGTQYTTALVYLQYREETGDEASEP